MKEEIERVVIRYDDKTSMLVLVTTPNVEETVVRVFSQLCFIEMLQADRTVNDDYNDEGVLFKNCVIYRTRISLEKAQAISDSIKRVFVSGIADEVRTSNN